MPKLQRHDYYDTARDMNWAFTYVPEEEAFPEALSKSFGICSTATPQRLSMGFDHLRFFTSSSSMPP